MLERIQSKFSQKLDVHTVEVITKAMSSSIVKVVGLITAFLVSIYLGRTIGADGLGIINLTFRIVNVLLIFGMLGIFQIIIREVAIAHEENNHEKISDVMNAAYFISGGMTLFISLIFIFLSPFLANTVFNEPRLTYPLMIALLVMAPQAFSQIFSASLIGRRKIWQSNLADQCLSIIFSALIFFLLWFNDVQLTIDLAAIVYAIGRVFVTVCMGFYWKSILFSSQKNVNNFKGLYVKAYPIFLASLSLAIMNNSGIIILGALSDSKEVGLYSVAARLAEVTIFIMHVANAAVSPKISALYKQNRHKELEVMLQKSTQLLFVIGLVFFITYVLLGESILGIWGEEFKKAYWILVVMCFGQFINISTGAVGQLLTMTGNQKKQKEIALICMILVLILMPIFILLLEGLGAALVTSISVIVFNVATLIYSKKVTGINAVSFSVFKRAA